jgi:hypothetical protein
MKRLHLICFTATVSLAATAAFASDFDQPIQVNTEGLQTHVAEQVRKHAAESEQALMQYLWFTRKLHHLWLDDVTRPQTDAAAQDEPRERRQVVMVHPHGFR